MNQHTHAAAHALAALIAELPAFQTLLDAMTAEVADGEDVDDLIDEVVNDHIALSVQDAIAERF